MPRWIFPAGHFYDSVLTRILYPIRYSVLNDKERSAYGNSEKEHKKAR